MMKKQLSLFMEQMSYLALNYLRASDFLIYKIKINSIFLK